MDMSSKIQTGTDNDREARVSLNSAAVLTESDGCSIDVVILDVSRSGFRLRSASELETGAEVLLGVDKLPAVRAKICWSCGYEAGGVFLDPAAL